MPQSFAEELGSIPMSPSLGQSLERAHGFAREQSHRVVTLEHLLLALTEDAEAALILQAANIDLGRLGTDVSGYLGRLLEDMRSDGSVEPRPDADLLRVLQAAASAAKQSRRKQIDGAIVLAAIVGDGKSPAAGMLKALGMTFEEAIRALQRANTKARLKPTSKPAAPAAVRDTAVPAVAEPAPDTSASATESIAAETAPGVSQSAEDILAAARARIQQRSAASKADPAEASPAPRAARGGKATSSIVADDSEPPVEVAEPVDTESLTGAIEAAMTGTTRTAEPAPPPPRAPSPDPPARMPPPAPPVAQQARPNWTPPPEPRPQPAKRLPQPPSARPFPARPISPGEGPRRPPLPPPPSANAGPPQAGFPNRPTRAPWPEPGERGINLRPALSNGALGEAPHAQHEHPGARTPQAPWSVPPARGSAQSDKGLLVESVPRRMRLGVPASAEVRIARDRIDALIVTLNGRGSPALAERSLMRALSVRLRAPGGDFWIEPAAPETQWVEGGSNLIHDDYAVWRWTVVARRRGRGRLTLMVSARTIGRDGVAAESAPPDRVIEVKIGGNYGQAIARWTGWIVAMLVGAAAGYFSEQLLAVAKLAIARAMGG